MHYYTIWAFRHFRWLNYWNFLHGIFLIWSNSPRPIIIDIKPRLASVDINLFFSVYVYYFRSGTNKRARNRWTRLEDLWLLVDPIPLKADCFALLCKDGWTSSLRTATKPRVWRETFHLSNCFALRHRSVPKPFFFLPTWHDVRIRTEPACKGEKLVNFQFFDSTLNSKNDCNLFWVQSFQFSYYFLRCYKLHHANHTQQEWGRASGDHRYKDSSGWRYLCDSRILKLWTIFRKKNMNKINQIIR